MNKIIILIISFFLVYTVNGQKRTLVEYGDKYFMTKIGINWKFKNNLPDGHYICSFSKDTNKIAFGTIISNNKKDRIIYENDIYKNVKTQRLFTFRNNKLNGHFIINSIEGYKDYDGYFKKGFADSLWTYYQNKNLSRDSNDTIFFKEKEIKYVKGVEYIINYWDKNNIQRIINGNGIIENKDLISGLTTTYQNGLKNGLEKMIQLDSSVWVNMYPYEKYYKNGLLINETLYYTNLNIKSNSEWCYPFPPKIDTSSIWFDSWSTDIYCNNIEYKYKSVPNGHWIANYENGNKIYEGEYKNGNRIGLWHWYFDDGNLKVKADYSSNNFSHYNDNGKLISNQNTEYLTLLTSSVWHFDETSNDSIAILINGSNTIEKTNCYFLAEGKVLFLTHMSTRKCLMKLNVDILEIECNDEMAFYNKFKIVSANDKKIEMKIISSNK